MAHIRVHFKNNLTDFYSVCLFSREMVLCGSSNASEVGIIGKHNDIKVVLL